MYFNVFTTHFLMQFSDMGHFAAQIMIVESRGSKNHFENSSFIILAQTFTGVAVGLIFPHETASSGRAPESLPSNSCAVFRNTEKSAPLR